MDIILGTIRRVYTNAFVMVLATRTRTNLNNNALETRISANLRLLAYADMRHGVEKPKYIAEPPQDRDDNNGIQNRLNGACHRDELVNQPQNYAHNDQSEHYLS